MVDLVKGKAIVIYTTRTVDMMVRVIVWTYNINLQFM